MRDPISVPIGLDRRTQDLVSVSFALAWFAACTLCVARLPAGCYASRQWRTIFTSHLAELGVNKSAPKPFLSRLPLAVHRAIANMSSAFLAPPPMPAGQAMTPPTSPLEQDVSQLPSPCKSLRFVFALGARSQCPLHSQRDVITDGRALLRSTSSATFPTSARRQQARDDLATGQRRHRT